MKMNEICSATDGEGFDDARGEGEKKCLSMLRGPFHPHGCKKEGASVEEEKVCPS